MKTNKKLLIASALLIAGISSTNAMYVPDGMEIDSDLNPNVKMLKVDFDNIPDEEKLIIDSKSDIKVTDKYTWDSEGPVMMYNTTSVDASTEDDTIYHTMTIPVSDLEIQDIDLILVSLSQDDQNRYKDLKNRVALKDQKAITNFVSTYETKLKKIDDKEQEKLNKTMISKVDKKINALLEKVPQDIAMDRKTSAMYNFLVLLKLELKAV